jgi:hypothetical protein
MPPRGKSDTHEGEERVMGRRTVKRGRELSDFVVIGAECFALRDGSVLSWRGENYTPQRPLLRVRLHNRYVAWRNSK